jgi:glycosyltransferase involved in cell wall biosynthesis
LHYRVAIYNRLSVHLRQHGWSLTVLAQGVQQDSPHCVQFELRTVPAATTQLLRAIRDEHPQAVILFVNAREPYLFPVLFALKWRHIPAIYWGHGLDLEDKGSRIKRMVYGLEHQLCDALLLYAEDLRRYIAPGMQRKTFIARNTIDTSLLRSSGLQSEVVLAKYGIDTRRNIICVGRLQRRKRIGDLVAAFERIPGNDCGLILVGEDADGCVSDVRHPRIHKLGPLFGDQVTALLEAADVYCMPGHVGLGIVDALYYGLPFVTEDVDHAPEIMYLKDGVNGCIVPAGDIGALSAKLHELLTDDFMRVQFSIAARRTIEQEASLELMFTGFIEALSYVTRDSPQ